MNTQSKGRRNLNKTIAWLKQNGAILIFPAKGLRRGKQHGCGLHQVDLIAIYQDGMVRLVESTGFAQHSRARNYLRQLGSTPQGIIPMVISWKDREPAPRIEIVDE